MCSSIHETRRFVFRLLQVVSIVLFYLWIGLYINPEVQRILGLIGTSLLLINCVVMFGSLADDELRAINDENTRVRVTRMNDDVINEENKRRITKNYLTHKNFGVGWNDE